MFAPNRLSEKDRVASIHQIKDINYPRNHVSKYLTIIKNFKPVRFACTGMTGAGKNISLIIM
jgi:hypothetical protein